MKEKQLIKLITKLLILNFQNLILIYKSLETNTTTYIKTQEVSTIQNF